MNIKTHIHDFVFQGGTLSAMYTATATTKLGKISQK